MPKEVLRLGVVGASYPPANRWSTGQVRPVAVMADLPQLERGARMTDQNGVEHLYLGDFALVLHSGETRHYVDNLRARQPSVWVAMAGRDVQILTVDPYEGEALAGDVERVVEALPMPLHTAERIQAFITAHHVEETFHKRKRVPATSPSDPRAPRVLSDNEKWIQSRGRAGRPGGKSP
ncbi:MAG: DUF3305 domain-containing protein [Pseudomonadota bacterium]